MVSSDAFLIDEISLDVELGCPFCLDANRTKGLLEDSAFMG